MASSDFTTYHVDASRTGTYTGATLTTDDIGNFEKYATIDLGSTVRGALLFVADWTFASQARTPERRTISSSQRRRTTVSWHTVTISCDPVRIPTHYPGDGNWWLASLDPGSGRFVWSGVSGDFTGSGQTEIVFYFPGDGNWWLATYADATRRFAWSLVGTRSKAEATTSQLKQLTFPLWR